MIVSSRFCERQVSRPIKSSVFWSGNKLLVDRLSDLLSACDVNDLLSGAGFISDAIKGCPGTFGLIYEDDKKVVCMVDLSRSWPIFYAGQGESFLVSDDGRGLAKEMGANDVDRNALIEFCSSGYVHGSKTLWTACSSWKVGTCSSSTKKHIRTMWSSTTGFIQISLKGITPMMIILPA